MDVLFKQELIRDLREHLQTLLRDLHHAIQQQNEGTKTSSSAGDKHNTEQAMQHLEQEKKLQQLAYLKNLIHIHTKLPMEQKYKVDFGALIQTNNELFYIGIPFGEFRFKNHTIMFISLMSPLAKVMLGKKVNDTVEFNQRKYIILTIV